MIIMYFLDHLHPQRAVPQVQVQPLLAVLRPPVLLLPQPQHLQLQQRVPRNCFL